MGDVASLSQFEHARLGDPLHATPVELGQLFEDREFRLADAAFHPVGIPLSHFCLRESQQVALAGQASTRGILSESRVILSKRWELELPEIAFEQGVMWLHDVLLRVEPACHTGPVCGVNGYDTPQEKDVTDG